MWCLVSRIYGWRQTREERRGANCNSISKLFCFTSTSRTAKFNSLSNMHIFNSNFAIYMYQVQNKRGLKFELTLCIVLCPKRQKRCKVAQIHTVLSSKLPLCECVCALFRSSSYIVCPILGVIGRKEDEEGWKVGLD